MNYIQFTISIKDEYQEPLIAELEAMNFDGFQQFDNELTAFIAKRKIQIGDRERIEQLLAAYPGDNFIQTEQLIEEQNWNSKWEKTIQPQSIGRFFVKPTWSNESAKSDQILLEIDPKMAFGTGYHATTRLMLKLLPRFISADSKVLDAGTGTGILAIASAKLGAKQIVAFDNDKWSIQNTKENILLNDTGERIEVKYGSTELLGEAGPFDLVLANINKNVIIEMLGEFRKRLKPQGKLLLSGILESDEEELKAQLEAEGFKPLDINQEEEWLAIWAEKEK